MKLTIFTFTILLLITHLSAQTYKGGIAGTVMDASTQEPLYLANIIVLSQSDRFPKMPTIGTSTDTLGKFNISKLEVGTYSLKVTLIGYETQVVTNVVVSTGRQIPVHVRLAQTVIETGEVTVQANYFSHSELISPVSSNFLDRSEIRRSPGSIQDVQRVVQILPGVASSNDNINELIVRGGSPFENLTVMDNMEIPSINHYSSQYNSAGPINMVNADMIQDVQFSAGGFPAQFGDKSSSVMNITVREGNRNIGFSSNLGFNMAGIGTLFEGGFANGNGSYIFSARKSLLEVVDKVMGMSALSLTAVPKYWDTQGKFVYDLSPDQRLKFNFLYGESKITIEGDPKEKDELRKNITDSSSVERIYPFNKQYVAGLNWQSLWGKKGFSVLTLYTVGSTYNVDVHSDFTRRVRGSSGEVLEYTKLNTIPIFLNHSSESFLAARYDVFYQLHPKHELSLGGQIQTSRLWKNSVWVHADTSHYDFDQDRIFEAGPIIIPEGKFEQTIKFGEESKYFLYASDKFRIAPKLALTFGLRYDHFTYPGKGSFSPRLSFAYQLFPPTTTLTLAAGRYRQTHPFPFYGDRLQIGYNKHLDYMYADHAVLSFEHILADGLKLNIEGYYKKYSNISIRENFIYSAIDTFWSDRNLTVGRRRSYGLEFSLEQKQVKDLFGTASLSLSKTEDADPRVPKKVNWYPSDYDYTAIVTVVGGHVVRGLRDWLNESPFFIKYPSYILPISNEMEVSFKYRFQTGHVYTPKNYVTWKQFREGGMKWSNAAWIDTDEINSVRYPNYSRLDIQWISRFYFQTWNINVYIAIQNVFNTKNIFYQNYRSDGTIETVYQFGFFPVGGFEVEF
ncbi:MAG: hypothetical protein COS95_04675 [Ignavibacteriales bacterium CG07_land_8_20_14_0_80_59_12]|nr:MAG: hypothetical protein COS95_04675 [Ignavibacteriales bacterium CG07_land_8_20_14_0_80_59_12]